MTLPYGLLAQNPQLMRLLMLGHGEIPPPALGGMVSPPLPQSHLATPFPNQSPVAPTPQPGIFDQIQNRLFPSPQGLQGLLSPQDEKAARRQGLLALAASLLESGGPVVGAPAPTLGQAIGRAIPQGQKAFQGTLSDALQARQFAQTFGDEAQKRKDAARLRDIQAQGDKVLALYPPVPGETDQQRVQRISKAAAHLATIDPQRASVVAETAQRSASAAKDLAPSASDWQVTEYQGQGFRVNRVTGEVQPLPTIPMSPELKAQKEADQRLREASIENARANAAASREAAAASRQDRSALKDAGTFQTNNKPLVATADAYKVAKVAFAEARSGNPAALKPALVGYASVADPTAVKGLRIAMLNYVTQADPSVKGRFDLAVERLASGRLPPQILNNIETLVDRIQGANAQTYEQRRLETVKRNPSSEAHIPSTESIFTVPGFGMPGAPPTGGPSAADLERARADLARLRGKKP